MSTELHDSLHVVFYDSILLLLEAQRTQLRELMAQNTAETFLKCESTSHRRHGEITQSAETFDVFLQNQRQEKCLLVHVSWGKWLDLLLTLFWPRPWEMPLDFSLGEMTFPARPDWAERSWTEAGKERRWTTTWNIDDLAFTLMCLYDFARKATQWCRFYLKDGGT